MKDPNALPRVGRRMALKWISSATASLAIPGGSVFAAASKSGLTAAAEPSGKGYGSDPDIMKIYKPGDLWPLTLSDDQRALLTLLCDIILPADDQSPSASSVGVPDFIDEWISSPYPGQSGDRTTVLRGLDKLEEEAQTRSGKGFVEAGADVQLAICTDFAKAARKDSKKDIGYRGNISVASWDGPPQEVLEKLGLEAQEI